MNPNQLPPIIPSNYDSFFLIGVKNKIANLNSLDSFCWGDEMEIIKAFAVILDKKPHFAQTLMKAILLHQSGMAPREAFKEN